MIEVIETSEGVEVSEVGDVTVIEVGVSGPQGPPGTLIEVSEDDVIVVTPLRELDFGTGFDVTTPSPRVAQIALDLSELAAGGELAGTLDAPTIDALHSGSTHQSVLDEINAHEIDVVGAHDGSAIAFTPGHGLLSADVQSAIEEVADEVSAGHPDLAAHDALGLATDAELATHAGAVDPHPGYLTPAEGGAAYDAIGAAATAQSTAEGYSDAALAGHTGDASDAHDASAVSLLDSANQYTATDVEAALAEVLDAEQAHEADSAAAHAASAVAFTPTGTIAATDVQAAIAEVASEAGGNVAADAIWDAKGDLAAGTGANTASKLTAGSNDTILMADSAETTGLKWVAPATPSTQAFGDSAAEGTGDTFTRGDHKHAMPAAPAGASGGTPAVVLGTAAAAGTASTFLRDDDTIVAFDATSPSTQAFGDAAATGSAAIAARRDHKHAMPSERAASSSTPAAVGTAATGTGTTDARADHVHASGAGTPSTQAFGDAAATGSGPAASMTDHKHAMPADPTTAHAAAADPHTGYVLESLLDAKGDLITASADNTPAKLTAGADDTILMADAAAAGGLKWVAPAIPSTQAFGDAAAAGTADTFTRGDHKHAMPSERAAASTTPAAVGTAAVGTGTTDARADHVHATGAGTPAAVSTANATGSGPAAAMTDHVHAHETGHTAHDTVWDAKGDLAAGTGADTASALTVGADDTILMADSAASTGLKWVASASPSAVGTAAATGTADTFTRGDHVHAHETGHTSHDTIWDAAGDLAQGTGADTAAKLTVGATAATLRVVAGSAAWDTASTATPAAIGTAAAGTSANPSSHDNHVHATGAGTPSTQASGDAAATGTGPAAAMTDHKHAMPVLFIPVTFAIKGAVATGTGVLRWYNRSARTLTFDSVSASVGTAPTGAALIVDVNIGGTTIYTTQASRPTIAISSNVHDDTTVPDVTTITDNSYLTVDVDQVGSTVAGSDLTVTIWLRG